MLSSMRRECTRRVRPGGDDPPLSVVSVYFKLEHKGIMLKGRGEGEREQRLRGGRSTSEVRFLASASESSNQGRTDLCCS